MSKFESSWQYTEQYPIETDAQVKARRLSLELGIEPVSRATAAQLSALTVMSGAVHLLEIGTGVGVSGLALLRHVPEAHLTSIDIEPEHHTHARSLFSEAGINAARYRLVAGEAGHVLPRFNTGSYDFVHIDADPASLLDYVEHALLLVRAGGTVAVPHALARGRVADPAQRDEITSALRDLLSTVAEPHAFVPALLPVGDGLLTLTKLPDADEEA